MGMVLHVMPLQQDAVLMDSSLSDGRSTDAAVCSNLKLKHAWQLQAKVGKPFVDTLNKSTVLQA